MAVRQAFLGAVLACCPAAPGLAAEPPADDPEHAVPMCEALGAGFYRLPGGETCVRLSGEIHTQLGSSSYRGAGDTPSYHFDDDTGLETEIRGRLQAEARSESELGPLRGVLRLQAGWTGGGDEEVELDQAYVQLGGLDLGLSESFWVDDHLTEVGNDGSHSDTGLLYGDQMRTRLGYRFLADSGLFVAAAAELDDTPDYTPDVVGKLGVEHDWGGVSLAAAYDSDADGPDGAGTGGAVNLKGALRFAVPRLDGDSVIAMGGFSDRDNAYAVGGRWWLLGSYDHAFSERFSASLGLQYVGDTDFAAAGAPGLWIAELSGVFLPLESLELRSELGYVRESGLAGTLSGFLRATRSF